MRSVLSELRGVSARWCCRHFLSLKPYILLWITMLEFPEMTCSFGVSTKLSSIIVTTSSEEASQINRTDSRAG